MQDTDAVTDISFGRRVLESPIPVLVNFSAPWCDMCQELDRIIARQYAPRLAGKIACVTVDTRENPHLRHRHHVLQRPTLILFISGREVRRAAGFENAQKLLAAFLSE